MQENGPETKHLKIKMHGRVLVQPKPIRRTEFAPVGTNSRFSSQAADPQRPVSTMHWPPIIRERRGLFGLWATIVALRGSGPQFLAQRRQEGCWHLEGRASDQCTAKCSPQS